MDCFSRKMRLGLARYGVWLCHKSVGWESPIHVYNSTKIGCFTCLSVFQNLGSGKSWGLKVEPCYELGELWQSLRLSFQPGKWTTVQHYDPCKCLVHTKPWGRPLAQKPEGIYRQSDSSRCRKMAYAFKVHTSTCADSVYYAELKKLLVTEMSWWQEWVMKEAGKNKLCTDSTQSGWHFMSLANSIMSVGCPE